MSTVYCTEADVYTYGLPRGALGNPGRLVDSSLAATSTIELNEHGLAAGDAVTFRVSQGGVLSAPLVAGTVYYALPLTDSTFQVSPTPNGSAITLTTDGESMLATVDLPFAQLCEFYSRWVEGFLPAHIVPLASPYPVIVVGVVAQLVAKRAQIMSGLVSESMKDTELAAKAQMERWAATVPIRDTGVQSANIAVTNVRRERFIGWGVGLGLGTCGLCGSSNCSGSCARC